VLPADPLGRTGSSLVLREHWVVAQLCFQRQARCVPGRHWRPAWGVDRECLVVLRGWMSGDSRGRRRSRSRNRHPAGQWEPEDARACARWGTQAHKVHSRPM